MATVITPPCTVCGRSSEMEVDSAGLYRWRTRQMLIQHAFPEMTPEMREQLKTGTHPACWDEMFEGFDEDEGADYADPDPTANIGEHNPNL